MSLEIPLLNDLSLEPDTSLGKGTFGIVKLATSKSTGLKYALKIVDLNKLRPEDTFCIERELVIHKTVSHPNIVHLFSHKLDKEKKEMTMVLEYIENGNLFAHIRKKKRLSETETFRIFFQIAQAIQYLHKNDILHRDIKPENVLLDKDFNAKLCDFGWATLGISLTRNTFCGTYEYMSPEVVFKRSYDQNIDVWALGVLLFEMVHGKSPYKARNLPDIAQKLLHDNKIAFSNDVSPDLVSLISGILKLDPKQRLTLNEIFLHPWVKRMCVFLDYDKKIVELTLKNEKIEKLPTRAGSLSLCSEKSSAKKENPACMRTRTIEIPVETVKVEEISDLRKKAKERRYTKIFESFQIKEANGKNVLKDMQNMI